MKLNRERLNRKFDDINKAINRLSRFLQDDKTAFLSNEDHIHVARSHLLIAIEAAIGICYHISAKLFQRAAAEYGECFDFLKEKGIFSDELVSYLKRLISLRNRMVHRYEEIDYGFIYDNIKEIIENLQRLIDETVELIKKLD